MNAYSTKGQARIRQRDLAHLMEADPISSANALRALEWRRGCEAPTVVRCAPGRSSG